MGRGDPGGEAAEACCSAGPRSAPICSREIQDLVATVARERDGRGGGRRTAAWSSGSPRSTPTSPCTWISAGPMASMRRPSENTGSMSMAARSRRRRRPHRRATLAAQDGERPRSVGLYPAGGGRRRRRCATPRRRRRGGRLVAVAKAADPDPWRCRLRDALERDGNGPRTGPRKPSESWPRLPTGAPAPRPASRAWPAPGYLGDRELAIDLLRRAQRAHPDDFWINRDLARCWSRRASPTRPSASTPPPWPSAPGANWPSAASARLSAQPGGLTKPPCIWGPRSRSRAPRATEVRSRGLCQGRQHSLPAHSPGRATLLRMKRPSRVVVALHERRLHGVARLRCDHRNFVLGFNNARMPSPSWQADRRHCWGWSGSRKWGCRPVGSPAHRCRCEPVPPAGRRCRRWPRWRFR